MTGADDAVVVVVGVDTFIGGRIAACLATRGAQVVGLARSLQAGSPSPAPALPEGGATGGTDGDGGTSPADRAERLVEAVPIEGDGPEAVVMAAQVGVGERRVAAVVHAEIEPGLCGEVRLGELTPEVWRERCARPIDAALWTARAGFSLMATGDGRAGQGGVLGFVCPSVALTGAAGHVALAATSEAVRLLAKSAARRWGRFGITSNAFAPDVEACLPPAPGDREGGLQVHATALDLAVVDPADDIASLLIYMAGPGAARLTGATLGADGGKLMAP